MIGTAQKTLHNIARIFNWLAAVSVTAMMLLTTADVVLRLFRRPITGAYEIVGLLGSVFTAFALAHTSVEKGHIAVDFLVQKFSLSTQRGFDVGIALVSALLFGFISRHCYLFSKNLRNAGEVSLTLQIPLHPFILGISVGCGLLSIVLLAELVILLTEGTGAKGTS